MLKINLLIDKWSLKWAWSWSCDLFKFLEIIDNISKCMLHESDTWPVRKKMRWHFRGQRWEWSDGCVALSYKIEFQVKGWETRIGWHNLGTTAEQVVMVWACAAKRRQWLGKEMYVAWGGVCQAKRYTDTKENLKRDCGKRLSGS